MSPRSRGSGDDGYTSLVGGERVPKYDPRPRAYGALDEASATLGLAKSLAQTAETRELAEAAQRDLYRMMAEVAASPDQVEKVGRFPEARLQWLEEQLSNLEARVERPKGFILSGDSPSSAAMDLARTVVRRAERHIAQMTHEGTLDNAHMLAYLNRLSSLCFLLVLWEAKATGREHLTPARA